MRKINFKSWIIFSLLVTSSHALTLRDSVEQTINTNPTIIGEQKNQDAFKKYVDEEEGDYLPTVDLETYYEESHTYEDRDDTGKSDAHKNGWNTTLKIEQILYDGGLTPSEVEEYKHRRDSNRFRSNFAIENIILDTTKSYLDLVQYEELMRLSTKMMSVQERNLVTAKEKEEISGEKLETYQVASKLHFTSERFLEQEDLKSQSSNDFKRYVGRKPEGNICRPLINQKIIPKTLEKTIELAVRTNYSILEEVENIKVQRENIVQNDANFLPKLLFQLQGQWDEDLALPENGRQDIYRARFFMSWNLYEGGKHAIQSKREILFLQEAKKKLDAKTAEIVSEVTKAYNGYNKTKQRVDMLKLYSNDNKNILEVYRKEFDAGTRTFIDILNAESELYTSRTTLIEREFALYDSYYALLLNLSMLSDSILRDEHQVCQKMPEIDDIIQQEQLDSQIKDINVELEGLFEDDESSADAEKKMNSKEDESLPDSFDDLYTNSIALKASKKTEPIKKKQKIEKSLLQPILLKKQEVKETIVSTKYTESYFDKFLNSPAYFYTLNLTTEEGTSQAEFFLKKYELSDKGYLFAYGKNSDKVKVLYGSYPTYKEAKKALEGLSLSVMSEHTPYIDSVKKHQKLYNRYN